MPETFDEYRNRMAAQAKQLRDANYISVADLANKFPPDMLKRMYPGGVEKYLVGGSVQQPLVQWPPPVSPSEKGSDAKDDAKAAQNIDKKEISATQARGMFDELLSGAKQQVATVPAGPLPTVNVANPNVQQGAQILPRTMPAANAPTLQAPTPVASPATVPNPSMAQLLEQLRQKQMQDALVQGKDGNNG